MSGSKSINWLRWLARVIGSLWALFLLMMGIGYAVTDSDPVTMVSVMVGVTFAGFVIAVVLAWWREKIGAILLIIWSVLYMIFMVTVIKENAIRSMLVISAPFLISAVLFLLSHYRTNRKVITEDIGGD
jgi:hypothetical protein